MDAEAWRNRTIYQVLTDRFAIPEGKEVEPCDPTIGIHCGGTWRGIYEHLDYIQNMNFDAIWISPIVAQMPQWTSDGEAYPGYWQQSLYEINLAFGSEEDLVQLIDEIHKRGMLVMLDIVVNHMAIPGPPTDDLDYSIMHPFNKEEYYHPYCANGYDDEDLTNLQNCWLGGEGALLADLDTESEEVQQMLALWIRNQIWKYGIDGLRIDAAMNVESEFFPSFMKSADIFATAETYTEHIEIACEYSHAIGSVLNYPLYFQLTYAFEGPGGDMQNLADTIKSISEKCLDPTTLGNFAENHDVVRFANHTQDMAAASNIISYIMTHDGIPVIYYGEEQHLDGGTEPYTNRAALWETKHDQTAPLYKLIANLNLFRRHVSRNHAGYLATESTTIDVGKGTIAFAKGAPDDPKVITVFNNQGADASDFKVELCDTKSHGYSAGDELFDVIACKSNTVSDNGCIEAWVSDGEPVVLFKKSELTGSTLCDIEGASDVEVEPVYISSTTWTTEMSGQLTVMHSATTMPLSDAPSSVTATATATAATGDSTGSANTIGTPPRYAMFTIATAFLIGSFW